MAKRKEKEKRRKTNNAKKLTLGNKMKAALVSKCNMTDDQATALWSEVVQNNDLN